MTWTEERVAELKRLWAEGITTGEIAKRLTVSKNSVVGKVHRLGLSGRPSPIKKKSTTETKPKSPKVENVMAETPEVEAKSVVQKEKEVKEIKKPKEETVAIKTIKETKEKISANTSMKEKYVQKIGDLKLVDLDGHTCRWPIGDPKDEKFHFCGRKVRLDQTYCEEHSEAAFVKQTRR